MVSSVYPALRYLLTARMDMHTRANVTHALYTSEVGGFGCDLICQDRIILQLPYDV